MGIDSMNQRHAPMMAMRNKEQIQLVEQCGCYCCLEVFASKDVVEWTDKGDTALCPKCKADCVLPSVTNFGELSSIRKYWLA
jgi:NAD-dependent SIR2 family protein deacetylase